MVMWDLYKRREFCQSPEFLSARTVFSFNLYDNKLARKGRDLLDLEAMVWSGLGAQNSYERMR
jgi:hypothetical protein